MRILILIGASFILGSIPCGVIIARVKGVDLKKIGSGNIGATNVLRSLGKGAAVLTLLGDVLKGTAAVAMARVFVSAHGFPVIEFGGWTLQSDPLATIEGLAGLSAILGHNFSLFLRFKGGKGVATSLGVLVIYSPQAAMLTLTIWLVATLITKYSSLGAIVSFGLLPVNVFLFDPVGIKVLISAMITLFILVKHIGNIERLIKGAERKIGERSSS
ncbi:MAG: acyl-phosphate glycerol 3-phosphate acyltransferase [Nitrospirae bacterium RBG_16_43_8]|nr:MAG: acyl-phosphate glycerol 3-phosphate acyltransferase [Nitrospirae bacterium RBG_16_43_8]